VQGKLVVWKFRKISLARRILKILASLWYIASCADLSISTLKKMKTLVRDFVWSSQTKGKTRAKYLYYLW
jgi:hypothetical protein